MRDQEQRSTSRQRWFQDWRGWALVALIALVLAIWRWIAAVDSGALVTWAGAVGWTMIAALFASMAVYLRHTRTS